MAYKSEGTAWLLWAGCFCGCCGLHRCYLNRVGTGVLWWLTGGLCGIGQVADMCAMSAMVAIENAKLTPATVVVSSSCVTLDLLLLAPSGTSGGRCYFCATTTACLYSACGLRCSSTNVPARLCRSASWISSSKCSRLRLNLPKQKTACNHICKLLCLATIVQ